MAEICLCFKSIDLSFIELYFRFLEYLQLVNFTEAAALVSSMLATGLVNSAGKKL